MTAFDLAQYVGHRIEYAGQVAEVRPDVPTLHLPLQDRKLWARWQDPTLPNLDSKLGQDVGHCWHQYAAADFRLVIPITL